MVRKIAFALAGLSAVFGAALCMKAAAAPQKEPVFILLYSRFYDHTHPHIIDERLQRVLALVDRLRSKYPQSGVSALLQFSGTTSQVVAERTATLHHLEKIRELQMRGLIDVGYTGEDEPSYLNRPKAQTLLTDTPEERWSAHATATEHFLNDFKDPVTGQSVPGLSGGLKRMQEVFGPAAFISGASPTQLSVGGDAYVAHEIRRLNRTAMMEGIPPADPRRGIEGYGTSAPNFSIQMSPGPQSAPEVFWKDGILRLSDTSLADNKPHAADEDTDVLRKIFDKLDRSHARVIKLEVTGNLRYLVRRADGSVVTDPLEWLYYHPDEPGIPMTMKSLTTQTEIETAYRREEATLKWLLEDFLPANPGSRFVSVSELQKMAHAAASGEVSQDQLKALASDINSQFARLPMEAPNYGRAGDRYFSLAESFELFAQALARLEKSGTLPEKLEPEPVNGPLEIPENNMGLTVASFTVAEVIHAAAQMAPRFSSTEWKQVPDNAIPAFLQLGDKRVNAAQFLRLMSQACLDPDPGKTLKINAVQMFTAATFMFPKNTLMMYQGDGWTLKPATLIPEAAAVR